MYNKRLKSCSSDYNDSNNSSSIFYKRMSHFDSDKSTVFSLQHSKSLGSIIVNNKKAMKHLRQKQMNTFNKIVFNLNQTLSSSLQLAKDNRGINKKGDINMILLNSTVELLKKEKYYQMNSYSLPKISKQMQNSQSSNELLNNNNKNKDNEIPGLFRKRRPICNYKGEQLKGLNSDIYFQRPKMKVKPSKIVKISQDIINQRYTYKKFSPILHDKIGNYAENTNSGSSYYDFGNLLKLFIKEGKVGVEFPGNIINKDKLGCVKTLLPKIVKPKINRIIDNENRVLPVPEGLIGNKGKRQYSRITMNEVYNDKNLLL